MTFGTLGVTVRRPIVLTCLPACPGRFVHCDREMGGGEKRVLPIGYGRRAGMVGELSNARRNDYRSRS
jgi:hypothetical protein